MLFSLDLFARRATCLLQVLDPERAASDALVVAKTALRGACLAGYMSTDGRDVCAEILRWLTDNPAADVAALAEKRARVDEVGGLVALLFLRCLSLYFQLCHFFFRLICGCLGH